MDIEVNYFSNFENNNINIKETPSYKLLHQNLMNAWNTLDQNMTYPHLIKKYKIKRCSLYAKTYYLHLYNEKYIIKIINFKVFL